MATLLLADDSLTTQKVVNLTFADEGIEVITADDGDMALQLFHERRPDIVLADVNMPGLNGYEVCEAIRKTNDSAQTPVVLLVGSFEPFDAETAHRVGANDYLTKPFSSIRRLVATVLAFLDERPAADEAPLPIDEVEEITVEPTISEPEPIAVEASFEQAPQVHESAIVEAPAAESGESEAQMAEPDMYATNDIEDLYTQSFAETVEMPHTIAERARFNDGSADDELIETTYSDQPQQAIEPQPDERRVTEEILQPIVHAESGTFETPAPPQSEPPVSYETTKLPPPDFAAEQAEPLSPVEARAEEAYDSPLPGQEVRPQDAPTEEYNFEYRSEETYFEPAAETASATADRAEVPPASVEPANDFVETSEMDGQHAEPPVEAAELQTEEPAQMPSSTPWDSVASASRDFSFDESNLLELPAESNSYADNDPNREAGAAQSAYTLSAETVEHIARIVASQMSEQLIREIAERVVPMVVEETLARQSREEVNS